MLENIDDWIPAPGEDKGKEKTTTTTTEKKKKKKKKVKKPGEEKTRRGKDPTSTKADNQETSPLSTSPPAPYPEPSTASSSMSTPTSPLVTRRRKEALRWSSNEVPTRTGGSDIVRSTVDLLGDLESSGDVEYYDVYDEGEGEGEGEEEEECDGAPRKSSGKAVSAPDLSRARKVEMVVSKLYELGNTAPQKKKKKRFLQRFGILGDVEVR
jgi:outer membrane biosynthesis protein TonB